MLEIITQIRNLGLTAQDIENLKTQLEAIINDPNASAEEKAQAQSILNAINNGASAGEIIFTLLNAITFDSMFADEAKASWEADKEKRQAAIGQIAERLGLKKDENGRYYKDITYESEEGYYTERTYYNITVDNNGTVTLSHQEGNYDDELGSNDTVIDGTWNLSAPGFGLTQEQIDAFKSEAQRKEEIADEYWEDLGLDPNIDWENLSPEIRDIFQGYEDKLWLNMDNSVVLDWNLGMLVPDPAMGEAAKEFISILYCFLTIVNIIETKKSIQDAIWELLYGNIGNSEDDKYLSGIFAEKMQIQMQALATYLKSYFDFINKYNQARFSQLQKEIEEKAREKAKDENSCWHGKAHEEALFQKYYGQYMQKLTEKYENVQKQISAVLDSIFDGMIDLFGNDKSGLLDDVKDGTNSENLRRDAGTGKYDKEDLNNEIFNEIYDKLTSAMNLRDVLLIIEDAKDEIRDAVFQIMTGIRSGNSSSISSLLAANGALKALTMTMFNLFINSISMEIQMHNLHEEFREMQDKAEEALDDMDWGFWISWIGGPLGWLIYKYIIEPLLFAKSNLDFVKNTDDGVTYTFFYYDMIADLLAEQAEEDDEDTIYGAFNDSENGIRDAINDVSEEDLFEEDKNGFWDINEEKLAELRKRVLGLINLQIALVTIINAKDEIKDSVFEIMNGLRSRAGTRGKLLLGIIRAIANKYLMALDLQIDTLMKKVQEHNTQRQELLDAEEAWQDAKWNALRVAISLGAIIASFLIPGVGVAIGAALVVALFEYLNYKREEEEYEKWKDIDYESEEKLVPDDYTETGDPIIDAFNRAEAEMARAINNLHFGNSTMGIGDDMLMVDSSSFMEASSQLTSLYMLQMMLLLVTKARQELKNIIIAMTMGVSSGSFGEAVKDSITFNFMNMSELMNLRINQIVQEVDATNRKTLAEEQMNEAREDFFNSLISLAITAVFSLLRILTTLQKIKGMFENVEKAREILEKAQKITTVLDGARRIYDRIKDAQKNAKEDFGKLEEAKRKAIEAVNAAFEDQEGEYFVGLAAALRQAILSMNTSLVEGVGNGMVGLNEANFIMLQVAIDKIFRRLEVLVMILEAKQSIRDMVSGGGGDSGWDLVLSAVDAQKQMAMQFLGYMKMQVDAFVDRHNQINEAKRALAYVYVSAVFEALSLAVMVGDIISEDWLSNLIEKIPVLNKIDKLFESMGLSGYIAEKALLAMIRQVIIDTISDKIFEHWANEWEKPLKGKN
jgi:hypothetical protein